MPEPGWVGRQTGAKNREAVRRYMIEHIGASNRECGEALGLSAMAVARHVKRLRESSCNG